MEDYIEMLVVVMCAVTDTSNRVKRFQKRVFFPLFVNSLTLEWLRKLKECMTTIYKQSVRFIMHAIVFFTPGCNSQR